jgi:hypothetical protein
MSMENTTTCSEESLDDMFELDIRVSSISDEEISLLLTYVVCTQIDCAITTSFVHDCS